MVKVDVHDSVEPAEVKVIVVPRARSRTRSRPRGGGGVGMADNGAGRGVGGRVRPAAEPGRRDLGAGREHAHAQRHPRGQRDRPARITSTGSPTSASSRSSRTSSRGASRSTPSPSARSWPTGPPRGGGGTGVRPQPGHRGPGGHQRPPLRRDRPGELLPALAHQGRRRDHRDGLPARAAARGAHRPGRADGVRHLPDPGGRGVRAHRRAHHRELRRARADHVRGAPHRAAARPASATWTTSSAASSRPTWSSWPPGPPWARPPSPSTSPATWPSTRARAWPSSAWRCPRWRWSTA